MIGNSRVKKMNSRDLLLKELLATATQEITTVSEGAGYPKLLKDLIIQSMIKIEEDVITVICREQDIDAVEGVVKVGLASRCLLLLPPTRGARVDTGPPSGSADSVSRGVVEGRGPSGFVPVPVPPPPPPSIETPR